MMNKKGGIVSDMFIVLILIFTAIFVTVISFTIFVNWNSAVQDLDFVDDVTKGRIAEMGNWFFLLDKAIPFIFVVLWGVSIMGSLLVRPEHPFFFLVSLVILCIFTIFSFIFVDFGTTLFDDPLLVATSGQLGNSMFFVNNFHWISFFVMFASAVWFYTKDTFGFTSGGVER